MPELLECDLLNDHSAQDAILEMAMKGYGRVEVESTVDETVVYFIYCNTRHKAYVIPGDGQRELLEGLLHLVQARIKANEPQPDEPGSGNQE